MNHVLSQSVLTLLPLILMNSPDLMEFVKDVTGVLLHIPDGQLAEWRRRPCDDQWNPDEEAAGE